MNDLKQIWEQDTNGADMLEQMLKSKSFTRSAIQTPLVKLKRNLALHIGYAIAITLGYAWVIYYFPLWQVQACMLLLITFNLWGIVKSYDLYKNINLEMSDANVLAELKKHYNAFSEWKRQSLRAALLVYPFAAAGGFMLGGTVGSGKPVEVFMASPFILIALAIMIVILVPLGYWLAKWMTKVAFGKYVDQLKERIDELEREG
jgi:uncharacterized membrane protein YhdT